MKFKTLIVGLTLTTIAGAANAAGNVGRAGTALPHAKAPTFGGIAGTELPRAQASRYAGISGIALPRINGPVLCVSREICGTPYYGKFTVGPSFHRFAVGNALRPYPNYFNHAYANFGTGASGLGRPANPQIVGAADQMIARSLSNPVFGAIGSYSQYTNQAALRLLGR
jgi:hypothetical protein